MKHGVRRWLLVALAACIAPAAARAATLDDFRIQNAQDLVDLCGTPAADPLYDDSINFCHGFVSGAWQYHQAQANGPKGHPIVCPAVENPKRAELVAEFVAWAKQHPQHMAEPAVEPLFRFLVEKWPCPVPPAPAKKGGAQ